MKMTMKRWTLFGVAVVFGVSMSAFSVLLSDVPLAEAAAAEWTDGTVLRVDRPKESGGQPAQTETQGDITMMMGNGETLLVPPTAKITDRAHTVIERDDLSAPSRVRFIADKGTVMELMVLEVLPR